MAQPWKVIAAFIGVFVAGAVFGGFFTLGMAGRSPETTVAPAAVSTPPATETAEKGTKEPPATSAPAQRPAWVKAPPLWQAPQLMRRYAQRLNLSSDQKERIEPLFQRAAEDYRRVQQNSFRETAVILRRLQQDLAQELDPGQRAKLEQWEREQRERLRKFEPRPREQRKNSNEPKQGRSSVRPAVEAESTTDPQKEE